MMSSRDVRQESRAGWGRIALTLLLAVLLKQIPWSGWWLILRPDFVLIMVLFWSLHRPSRVGMGLAFAMGLLGDFQDGVVFGQHTSAYVMGVYAVRYFRLRFLQFDAAQQAAQMLPVLLMVQCVVLIAGWLSTRPPLGINILLPALSGTLMWYLVALMAQSMYAKRSLRQHGR